ncbi:UNVERIFIED_CONTAM: autophagy protein [Siphonaria sp. JEL0065]|nr:autophagy protein [Siphonaria sp. JEL0065]
MRRHSTSTASPKLEQQLLGFSFNQDASCVSVGIASAGFSIFNCEPFGRFYTANKDDNNSFKVVEMLFCTSLVALVGAGLKPEQSPRRLQIMNTKRNSTICELTFVSAILSVKLNRKRLIVVLEEHIYIYDIANMKLVHTIDTAPNPHALCALSPSSENCFLAYPPSTSGTSSGDLLIFDVVNLQAVNIVQAHKSPLSCIVFSYDGTLVATSSDKGTVIRVFSVPTGQKLFQLRRGTYNANIHSIAFDLSNRYLCVSSDTDTIHIYKLLSEAERKEREKEGRRRSAPTSDISGISPGNSVEGGTANSLTKTLGGYLGTGFAAVRSPLASATSAVSSFLPNAVTEMWEPQRDFAFAKIPQTAKGFHNICAIIGGAGPAMGGGSPGFGAMPMGGFDVGDGMSASQIGGPLRLVVVSASGLFYTFGIDGEVGGECQQLKEFSLLDD